MSQMIFIDEDRVRQVLNWELTFKAIEKAMEYVSKNSETQTYRSFTRLPNTSNLLLTMPGFFDDEMFGALACKLVTAFPNNAARNESLPTILANIALFNDETGALKAIIAGTEITKWRTAAASAVATKYLHGRSPQRKNKILAVFGSGIQGRIHAIAFQHFFNFDEVRIWNHRPEGAKKLADELNRNSSNRAVYAAFANGEECAREADVIVTATFANSPIVKLEWVKPGAHINAVGAGTNHHSELDESIYKTSDVFIDYWSGAKKELSGLEEFGVRFKGEIGGLISGALAMPSPEHTTVFQSLGMAVEDCAMARLVYDLHFKTAL